MMMIWQKRKDRIEFETGQQQQEQQEKGEEKEEEARKTKKRVRMMTRDIVRQMKEKRKKKGRKRRRKKKRRRKRRRKTKRKNQEKLKRNPLNEVREQGKLTETEKQTGQLPGDHHSLPRHSRPDHLLHVLTGVDDDPARFPLWFACSEQQNVTQILMRQQQRLVIQVVQMFP